MLRKLRFSQENGFRIKKLVYISRYQLFCQISNWLVMRGSAKFSKGRLDCENVCFSECKQPVSQ